MTLHPDNSLRQTTVPASAARREALAPLKRSSLSEPHPLSIHSGYAMTHAAFFAPLPEPPRDGGPFFTQPFQQRWPWQAMHTADCGLVGFRKAFYQGYSASAEASADPLHPRLPFPLGPLRYDAPTSGTARRLLQPEDFREIPEDRLWAAPLFEWASESFIAFRRNSLGQGEILLRTTSPAAAGVLCLYRVSLSAQGHYDTFFYNIPPDMNADTPIGPAPDCRQAYLGAFLMQRTASGAMSRVHQMTFECQDHAEGREAKTLFGRTGKDSYHGRQAYPPVYVKSLHPPAAHTPAEHYALLCSQFTGQAVPAASPPLCDFVREVDNAALKAEGAPRLSETDINALLHLVEQAEERLLPRIMEAQILIREEIKEAAGPTQPPLGGLLTALIDETRQAWNVLQDIRFRRIPALGQPARPRLVVTPGTGPNPGPFQGPGDLVPLPGGGYCVSDPQAGSLSVVMENSGRRAITGPWTSVGRMRAHGDGLRLLDPESGILFELSPGGEVRDALDLDRPALARLGLLPPMDFLLHGDHILIACLTRAKDATAVVRLTPGHAPTTLFHLDQGIFPFESWALWGDRLVLPSSKIPALNILSLTDGSWSQATLPMSNSYIRGLSLCGSLLFLDYPPGLFIYDLAQGRLAGSTQAPHVVGRLPALPRTFHVAPDGGGFRMFISTDDWRIAEHALTIEAPASHIKHHSGVSAC
jgi:hypothetical protein